MWKISHFLPQIWILGALMSFKRQVLPKCELPKVIIRHNIGPISAAKSRLLLLGQCHCSHRSSAGPTTEAFFDCLNLPTFSRNLSQNRPYTKPNVIFTMASSSKIKRARVGLMDSQVHTGVIIPATARHW